MATTAHDLTRLSLNQITTQKWTVREAIAGCVRSGIPYIGLWRDKVAETGLQETIKILQDSNLRISSLCRGGWFPAGTAAEFQAHIDDNRRAIEEAAALGTDTLVLVCGPAPDRDIDRARQQVYEAIAQLVPYAAEHRVKLGIEPLHPMYAAERSVIVTLAQANQLAAQFPAEHVGVVIDVFHVWWDPALYQQIALAEGRILGFHISDWLAPLPSPLLGRGMMGDGSIELRRIRQAVDTAGYNGPIEVEIFNQQIWDTPGQEVLSLMCQRYLELIC